MQSKILKLFSSFVSFTQKAHLYLDTSIALKTNSAIFFHSILQLYEDFSFTLNCPLYKQLFLL